MSGGFGAAGSFSSKLAAGEARRAKKEMQLEARQVESLHRFEPTAPNFICASHLFLFFIRQWFGDTCRPVALNFDRLEYSNTLQPRVCVALVCMGEDDEEERLLKDTTNCFQPLTGVKTILGRSERPF